MSEGRLPRAPERRTFSKITTSRSGFNAIQKHFRREPTSNELRALECFPLAAQQSLYDTTSKGTRIFDLLKDGENGRIEAFEEAGRLLWEQIFNPPDFTKPRRTTPPPMNLPSLDQVGLSSGTMYGSAKPGSSLDYQSAGFPADAAYNNNTHPPMFYPGPYQPTQTSNGNAGTQKNSKPVPMLPRFNPPIKNPMPAYPSNITQASKLSGAPLASDGIATKESNPFAFHAGNLLREIQPAPYYHYPSNTIHPEYFVSSNSSISHEHLTPRQSAIEATLLQQPSTTASPVSAPQQSASTSALNNSESNSAQKTIPQIIIHTPEGNATTTTTSTPPSQSATANELSKPHDLLKQFLANLPTSNSRSSTAVTSSSAGTNPVTLTDPSSFFKRSFELTTSIPSTDPQVKSIVPAQNPAELKRNKVIADKIVKVRPGDGDDASVRARLDYRSEGNKRRKL